MKRWILPVAVLAILILAFALFRSRKPGGEHPAPTPLRQEPGGAKAPPSLETAPEVPSSPAAPAAGWRVTGRVVLPGNRGTGDGKPATGGEYVPAPGVKVTLESGRAAEPSFPPIGARASRTGPDGRFEFPGLPGGAALRLEVDSPCSALRVILFDAPRPVEDADLALGDILLDPAFEMRLRLVDTAGHPVPGAKVMLARDGWLSHGPPLSVDHGEGWLDAWEISEGWYVLDRLPPGQFQIYAEAEGCVAWLGDGIPLPRSEPLVVHLHRACRFDGTVTSMNGEPIAGAEVREEFFPTTVKTDASGRFSIAIPRFKWSEEELVLEASARGYSPSWRSVSSWAPRTQPEPGEEVEFRLVRAASVSGRVVTGEGRNPISGAEVRISGSIPGNFGRIFARETETGADGRFTVIDIPPGKQDLSIYHPAFVPVLFSPLALEAGATVEGLEYKLEAASSIRGKVVEAGSSLPVAGAEVILTMQSAEEYAPFWITRTARDGGFAVGSAKDGNCSVKVRLDGYEDAETEATIPADVLTITVEPRGSISGRVVNSEGSPVPWAQVRLEDPEWRSPADARTRRERGTVTDSGGRFQFRGIEKIENFTIVAEREGFSPGRVGGVTLLSRQALDGIVIRLPPDTVISGRLVDDRGKAIEGGWVRAVSRKEKQVDDEEKKPGDLTKETPSFASEASGPDGSWVIHHLPAGTYMLSAEYSARLSPSGKEVTVAEGSETGAIEFVFTTGETIRGRVTDRDGRGIPEVRIDISREVEGEGISVDTETDEEGRFQAAGLAACTYTIHAWKDAHTSAKQEVTVPTGEVLLRLGRPSRIVGRVEAKGVTVFDEGYVEVVEWGEVGGQSCPIDPGGKFTATIEPGDYALQAEVQGFAKSWIEISVGDGERKEVVLPLVRGGSVAGQVVSKDSGEPVDAAPVYLVAVGGRRTPRFLYTASTDNDGKFEIKDIVEGEATLVVVERWFAHGRVEGIPIVAGETVRIDLVLGRGPGINGGVEAYGQSVFGAKVEVHPDGGGEVGMAVTGDDGLYEVLVPPGKYEVSVEVGGREGGTVKLSGKADVRPDRFTPVFLILKKEDQ